jgi:RNA polymerase sigma-70 factor (sigma-E family)
VVILTELAGAAARPEAGVEAIGLPPTIEDLFRAEWGRLIGLARLLVDDRGEAEEVVQEAFTRLVASRANLREPDKAPAWLTSTVMNLARARLRRRLVALRHRSAPEPPAAPADDEVLAGDDRRRAVAVLRGLPRRQRECLALRHWSGLTEQQIADALGISTGSVKQHIHRGMAVLGRALKEEG